MTRASHRRLTAAIGVLVLSLLSCGREITGPDEGAGFGRTASFALEPHLPGPMAVVAGAGDVVPFTRVRAILLRSDNSELFSQVVDFPANADEVPLTLNVPLPVNTPASGLPLQLLLRYINAAGDTVFAGGPVAVTAIPLGTGNGQPQPVTITLNWVGPGSNAAAVELSPPTGTAVAGTTTAFSVVVRDGQGQPMAGVPVVYSTPDPTIAGIAAAGNGTVTWLPVRGTARVIASLPSGTFADTALFTIALPPSQLTLVSGGAQTALINSALGAPITVRASAADAVPVAGVQVTFAVVTGGGTLGTATATTDANGDASTTWTLGALVGAQTITATFAGLATPLTVTATASPPPATQLVIASGIVPRAAGILAADVVVEARDALGNVATQFTGPVTGWVEVGPPGTNEDSVTVNAVAGVATFTNVTFDQVGTYTLRFRAAGLTDATSTPFSVTAGVPAVLNPDGGDLQSGLAGTLLPTPLLVRLTDEFGNPIAGATIDFTVQSGGGSLSVPSAVTDAGGLASTQYTLGAAVGAQVVRATLNSDPTVFRNFTLTATAGPAATLLIATSPAGLTAGQVGTFVVEVRDAVGNVATSFTGNVTLAIAVEGGPIGGVIGGTATRAAVAGIATFDDVFFNIRGQYNLEALADALPAATLNGFPVGAGPLSVLTIVSGDAQSGSPGAALALPLVVRATDAFGNGVSTNVTFAVATGLGSVTPTVVATDLAGQAQTAWTLGAPLGPQTVTATAPGVTAVTFTANAVPVTGGIRVWSGAVSSAWSNPANWSGGVVPTSLDTVRIGDTNGAALDANVVISGLEVQNGGSLAIGDFVLVVVGSLSAPTSPAITVGANGGLGLQSPSGGTVSGVLPTVSFGGGPYDASNVTVNGDVTVVSGRLILDDETMSVSGLFATGGTGALEMLSGSTLTVEGDAAFLGGSTAGLLTGGQLFIGGDFIQGGGSPDAFAASPGHETWFSSATAQSISFVNPGFGPGTSHFGTLYSGQPGTSQLDLQTDVYVDGALETGVTPTAKRFVGADRLIVSLGADIDAAGIEFDGVRWELRDGAGIAALQNITFRNVPGNRTQWVVTRAGGSHLVPQLRFLTPPTTGRYLELGDSDPGNGDVLTLDVTGVQPSTHGGAVLLLGGAQLVGWPETAGFRWTGATSSDWLVGSNWAAGTAPTATDSVDIVPGTPFAPTLSSLGTHAIRTITVRAGATLTITDPAILSVGGSVDVAPTGAIGGNGRLRLSSPTGGTVRGSLPETRVEGGAFVLAGNTTVNGNLETYGEEFVAGVPTPGDLAVGNFDLTITNGLFIGLEGYFTMTGTGTVDIAAYANFFGKSSVGRLTNGVLRVRGDFDQIYSVPGSEEELSFSASGNHVVELVGTGFQRVRFDSPDSTVSGTCALSCFATLRVLKPAGSGGVLFSASTKALVGYDIQADSVHAPGVVLISGGGVRLDTPRLTAGGIAYRDTLIQNAVSASVDSVIAWGAGTPLSNIPGVRTIVRGSHRIRNPHTGPVDVTGQLDVEGAALISGAFRTLGTGTLRMTDATDSLVLNSGATFGGGSTAGLLTAGVLEVANGFSQTAAGVASFAADPGHRVRLLGTNPVSFVAPTLNAIGALDVNGGATINTRVPVLGTMRLVGASGLSGPGRLAVAGDFFGGNGSSVTLNAFELGGVYSDSGSFAPDTAVFTGVGQQVVFDSPFGTDPAYNSIRVAPGATAVAAMAVGNTNVSLLRDLVIEGDFTMNEPSGPRVIDVGQDLRVVGNGLLRMQGNYSEMRVFRDAVFAGREMNGEMVTGRIGVTRNLTQLATTSPRSLRPGSNFEFQFRGTGTTSFASPSESYLPHVTHFANLTRTLSTDVTAIGGLLVSGVNNVVIQSDVLGAGGTRTWAAIGFDITGTATMRNVRARITGGDLIRVNGGLTMAGFDPNAIQLEFERSAGTAVLQNTDFQTQPSGAGRFLRITDDDGAASGVFTVNVSSVTPPTHGGFAQAVNGAVINGWAGATLRTYTGLNSGDWRVPANWSGGVVPGAADTAFISSTGNGTPHVTPGDTVRVGVLRHNGTNPLSVQAPIVLRDSLFVFGSSVITCDGGGIIIDNPFGAGVGFNLVASNCPVTVLRGTARPVSAFTQVQTLTVRGDGLLDLNGRRLLASTFITLDRGRVQMTNPSDSLEVNGSVFFAGENTSGLLTDGNLLIGGTFQQVSAQSPTSFRASGSHITTFTGINAATITFDSPGASSSGFATVNSQKGSTGSLTINGAGAHLSGSATVFGGGAFTLNGPANVVVVGSFNVFSPSVVTVNAGATLSTAGCSGSGTYTGAGTYVGAGCP